MLKGVHCCTIAQLVFNLVKSDAERRFASPVLRESNCRRTLLNNIIDMVFEPWMSSVGSLSSSRSARAKLSKSWPIFILHKIYVSNPESTD